MAGLLGAEAKVGMTEQEAADAAGGMAGYRKFGDKTVELDGPKCLELEKKVKDKEIPNVGADGGVGDGVSFEHNINVA